MHVPMHVLDAPTINEDDVINNNEVFNCIEKYITCLLPNETFNLDLHKLAKQVEIFLVNYLH